MNKNDYYDELNYLVEDADNPYLSNSHQPPPSVDSNCDDNTYILGNSVNFSVSENDNEIKADMIVHSVKSVRVWGQIKDCDGDTVVCAYVKLLKVTPNGLIGIAHTLTDCQGFYQFDICANKDSCNYTVVVGKAATGCERVISSGLSAINHNTSTNPDYCKKI